MPVAKVAIPATPAMALFITPLRVIAELTLDDSFFIKVKIKVEV